MVATYRVLCEHGYAGLTLQRIAERFSKGKSLLSYRCGNTDELLVEFLAATVERRAQAAHDERYRAPFSSHDAFFRDRLAAVVARGVEDGSFCEVDPDRVASLLLTTIVGTTTRRATVESLAIDEVRAAVDASITSALLTPEAEA